MTQLVAYNGSKTLKKDLLAEARKHQKADQFVQGTYGEGKGAQFKGCAVGCTIDSYNIRHGMKESVSDHSVYERDLGIPRILARLEDRIFEGLSVENSKKFPIDFLNAITPGADLTMVWYKFVVWLLEDKTDGVIKFAKTVHTKKSIEDVIKLYKRHIKGEAVAVSKWRAAAAYAYAAAAAAAAYAATTDAAYAAAYAAAAAAAAAAATTDAATATDAAATDAAATAAADAAAADAAAAAYAAAAYDAAYAAYDAAYAARKTHYKKMADKLIELLKEAK